MTIAAAAADKTEDARTSLGRSAIPAQPVTLTTRFVIFVAMFVLSFDFPVNWFKVPGGGQTGPAPTQAQGYVALTLLVCCGYALATSIGQLDAFLNLIWREPLLPLFLGLAVTSAMWSDHPFQTIRFAATLLLILFLGYWIALMLKLADVLLLVAVVLALGIVLHYVFVFGFPEYGQTEGGWVGLLGDKNALGRLSTLSALHMMLAAGVFKQFRVFWALMVIPATVLVVFSDSATSLGSLGLLGVILIVSRGFRARRTLYGAVSVAMFGSVLLTVFLATANLGFVTNALGKDVTLTGRTKLWDLAFDSALKRPFLGHGWGGFWNGWFSPSHPILLQATWNPPHSHNAWLDYFLTLGLVGLSIMVVLYARFMIRAVRAIRFRPGTLGLWPVMYGSYGILFSITEAGVVTRDIQLLILVVLISAASQESRSISGQRDFPGKDSAETLPTASVAQ